MALNNKGKKWLIKAGLLKYNVSARDNESTHSTDQ